MRLLYGLNKFFQYFASQANQVKSLDELQAKHPNFIKEVCLAMEILLSLLQFPDSQKPMVGYRVAIAALTLWHNAKFTLSNHYLWIVAGLYPSVVISLVNAMVKSHPKLKGWLYFTLKDVIVNVPIETLLCEEEVMKGVSKCMPETIYYCYAKRLENAINEPYL